jgi:hypothetical protein
MRVYLHLDGYPITVGTEVAGEPLGYSDCVDGLGGDDRLVGTGYGTNYFDGGPDAADVPIAEQGSQPPHRSSEPVIGGEGDP